jgi:peptidoglycan/LPS O-acetylase OafA/YrhL
MLIHGGSTGVSIFFVVSGYLITVLLLEEQKRTGTVNLYSFYVRRVFRIAPAFYLFLLSAELLSIAGIIHIPGRELASSLLFVNDYVHDGQWGDDHWWLGHTWSLAVEEQFYLLWPAILVAAGRRTALWFAVSVILLSPAIRVATHFVDPLSRSFIPFMFHTRADMLMFGCMLALVREAPPIQNFISTLSRFRADIASVALLFGISPLLFEKFGGQYLLPAEYTLVGVAVCVVIACSTRDCGGFIERALNWKLLTSIGAMSYSVYLWQQLLTFRTPLTPLLGFPLNVLAVLAIGWLSYTFAEAPFRRLGRRISEQHLARLRVDRLAVVTQEQLAGRPAALSTTRFPAWVSHWIQLDLRTATLSAQP